VSEEPDDFFDAPNVIGNARFHCRGNAKRLMDAPEVVVHEVECHGCGVVLDLFENGFVRRVKRRIDIRIVTF
jgi:hypothetical protein